jgi:uncharacterized protein with ACT and thioredoxin-like domain
VRNNYPHQFLASSTDGEYAEALTRIPRLARLRLHHGIGSLEGYALANAVRSIRKFHGAPISGEVIAARERVATAARDLEL